MVMDRHYSLAREEIIAALTAYTGITTADGATPVFNTLIDANLIGENDFISGKTVLIGSGDALYEDKGAASFDNTDGTITVGSPFSAQIKAGTIFRILNAGAGQVTELLDALVSYRGTTTADGAIGGGTLVCSDLTTKPDFDGNQAVIKSGSYAGQVRDIDGVTTGGTVTPHTSFGGTITEGTRFSITAIRTVPAEIAALDAKVGTNTDPAGTTTLFAWLAKLFASSGDIFATVNALLTLTETGGTVTTTGGEDDVYVNDAPAGVYEPKKVMIDFTNQTAAETVVVRTYYRIKSTGNLILKDEVTFAGVQDPPLINVELEPNRFGVEVTMERTAGGAKDYDWEALYAA